MVGPHRVAELPHVSASQADRILTAFGGGDDAAPQRDDRVAPRALGEKNPYLLLKIDGLGFKTVDSVATQVFGIDPDYHVRHLFGNTQILRDKGKLGRKAFRVERAKLGLCDPRYELLGVIPEDDAVWEPKEFQAELTLANYADVVCRDVPVPPPNPEEAAVFARSSLNPEQTRAACSGLHTAFTIITGDAGTGKNEDARGAGRGEPARARAGADSGLYQRECRPGRPGAGANKAWWTLRARLCWADVWRSVPSRRRSVCAWTAASARPTSTTTCWWSTRRAPCRCA